MNLRELDFAVGWCDDCERRVLVHADCDAPDQDRKLCVHCDTVVTKDLRIVPGAEIEDSYGLVEDLGCGRPDCGRGRCGRPD